MTQDTNVNSLIINKLTKQQFEGLSNPDPTQLYFITDDNGLTSLDDISISNLTNGQILQYDALTGKWKNADLPEEGSGANTALSNLSTDGNARLHALKGYEDAGELLTDAEGLADVKSYEHSSFDLTKFTVTGSPTITNDGIVSNFSIYGTSYLTFPAVQLADYDSWEIITPTFRIDDTLSSGSNYLFLLNYNLYFGGIQMFTKNDNKLRVLLGSTASTDSDILLLNTLVLSEDIDYKVKIQFTGTRYIVSYKAGSGDWTEYGSADSTVKFYSSLNTFRIGYACGNITMDLKQFSIKGDGVSVFSGNKTGTDTYTINSSTVSIPYALSKTGSKIVESSYRTDVASVYNEFGYAPYYTLSDTDFTLPQGEIYGMIERNSAGLKTKIGFPDYSAGISISTGSYTPLKDGLIVVEGGDNNEAKQISVNNNRAAGAFVASNTSTDICAWVQKGDSVTISGTGVTVVFFPLKGV